ncbi:MAG TPA: hypothetical protein VLT59_06060 [Steroidobacteraceae bacterium]|nr:hypothetical protein [Steroidobacteraceae bacterium]
MRSSEDRLPTVAGLALLEHALQMTGIAAPPLATLEYPEGSPPHWTEGPRFSLSHTDGLVACAVTADCAVRFGIDIERIRPISSASLRLAMPEARLHARLGAAELLAAWTRCEAVLKAAGASLTESRAVRLPEPGNEAAFAGRVWRLTPLALPTGFVGSCASSNPDCDIDVMVAGSRPFLDNRRPGGG